MDPAKKEWEGYSDPESSSVCKRIVHIMRKGITPEEVAKLYSDWAENLEYEKVNTFPGGVMPRRIHERAL